MLWHVTPAQALVWAECIRRRRALRMAEEMEMLYLAEGAAQGGKVAFRTLRATVKRLRQEAGISRERDPEQLIQALGLTDRRAQ